MNSETRICQNCKQNFVIEPADFAFYEKMQVPAPTWCPECRAMRRMTFWNQSNLFRKTERRTGNTLFSTYSEQSPVTIYDREFYLTDAWDPLSYGKEYNFSIPFFQQFRELFCVVPLPNRAVGEMVRSDYCNQANDLKDCYLCFNGDGGDNCLYCVAFMQIRDCVDCQATVKSELCYETYEGGSNYQCFFSSDVYGCRNVWFSKDCTNCSDCVGSFGLKNKQHCIFNQQYTKEE